MMTGAQTYVVVLVVLWVGVSGFFAGFGRAKGELMWMEVMRGERPEERHLPRWYYLWVFPAGWFFLWPLETFIANWARDRARRRS